ncbi:MAG: hypothetical protein IPL43_00220 [Micropruina sp.]|nr:hypothetical protein [Micropruina sp.]
MTSDDYQALLLDYVWYSFWTAHEAGWQAALTLLPILAALSETAAEALIGHMSWFADRGSQEEAQLLADLAELAPPHFLDEWLARRRDEEPPSTRLRTRLTPVGLKRLTGVVPVPDLLGTVDDRQAALEVMRVRHDLREPTDHHDMSGDVNRLIRHAANSDQALAEPIAAALIAIARYQSQEPAGYAPLETAVRAALAADDLARQRPWDLETIASALGRGPRRHSLAPQADELHKRALAADPADAGILGNYANFLTTVRRDHDGAEALYRRALDADPTHANNLGNYAYFLTTVRRDHDGAEALYRRALDADPTDANHLGNYANFLTEVRRDHDGAEALYRRALDADPTHANNLGSYALLLSTLRRDRRGRSLLPARPLDADPADAGILGNYANFLNRKCAATMTGAEASPARPSTPTPPMPTSSAATRSSSPPCAATMTGPKPYRRASTPTPPMPTSPAITRTSHHRAPRP